MVLHIDIFKIDFDLKYVLYVPALETWNVQLRDIEMTDGVMNVVCNYLHLHQSF